jgi:acyl transferase domain-containing protein/acyl carrier protein
MVDFVEYVVSELKSKRLGKAGALALIRQFSGRRTAPEQLHPLVHRNVSTLNRQRYRTHLCGDEFFLRDHRVRMPSGAAVGVLPGVAYLEMARAAVVDAVPELADGALLAFEDVLWLSPFAVESPRAILIDIDAGEDCLEFRVFSEDAAAGHHTEHASGRVRFYDAVDAAPLDLTHVRAAMTRDHWDADTVYASYAQIGIEYGPAHRGIVGLDSGDGQVLGELALPEMLAGQDNAAYVLHPSLIDSALQAAIGLGERGAIPGDPMLPFALESLCILGDCGARPYVFVRRADAGSTDTAQLTLDLDLCDEHGKLCVQMRGFSARRFDARSAAAPADAAAVETLIAVPGWSAPLPPAERAPAASFAHVRVLLCELPGRDALATKWANAHVEALAATAGDDPAQRYASIALQVFERLQEVLKHRVGDRSLLQCAIADNAEGRLLAGLGGLLRTATLENPSLTTQLVLVDPLATPEQLAADLAEAAARPHLAQLRCAADGCRTQAWTVLPPSPGADESPYREHGVYLITGGLGGLGALFAREILAQSAGAQLVLTGRSAEDDALRARLAKAFEACDSVGRVHYRRLDLDDAAQCAQVVDAIGREIGPIRGVLHCAGTRNDEVILKKTVQDAAAVLAPKVRGTWHLDEATRGLDLDFFALFSSGVAAFGNVGQADYAAANGFLDAFAAVRDARVAAHERSGRTVSIAWPLWDEGGMRPDPEAVRWLQAQTGMLPMRSASGLAVFRRALASPHAQVFAIEGDGRRLRRLFDAPTPPARRADPPVPAVARERMPHAAAIEADAAAPAGDLLAQARDFLRREFAPVLKIAANQIDTQEALENYGINSILAMNLTAQLEKHFGPLPKTLFFEYQTIAALGEHLVQAHAERLQALVVPAAGAAVATAPTASRPATASSGTSAVRQAVKPTLRGKAAVPGALVRRGPSGLSTIFEPIAIVGLSGRYPEADTLREFWRNLHDGRDCIVEIPAERWHWRDYFTDDRDRPGHYSKWGGFIRGADEFDPQFFNISPREAPYIDPQERLFLQHAWMAIEDAGYSRKGLRLPRANGLPGQVGVYAGVMYGEYNRSGSLASIANRVSYALNVHGPSMTLDTMCSSSLTAIHLACQDLRLGRTDMALAGGVNLSIHPGKYSMLSAGQFISSDGHCQSFGEGGDGYIPGEGVGVVVLKRLSDAERDGDAIHAVIRGSALNHGGKTNGYTVPNPQAQAAVIADALRDAGVDARQVSYIEAHGTGTKLGDPIEIAALSKAFREHTPDTGFCLIGSAKSNIGHCESAAGIAGLTKVVLQMRHRQIVPSLHSARLNPNIDFGTTPFEVNQRLRDWDTPVVDGKRVPRIAGLSSFGAGGANAHFVIEEYVLPEAPAADGLPQIGLPAIVPLSARTPEQLMQKVRDLLFLLQEASDAGRRFDLASLAYTLQVGREAMEERLAFVVDSTVLLQDALSAHIDGDATGGYRSQVRANREMLALFVADDDYDAVLDKWIAQRKLPKLAELWSKGLDLDWRKFHGQHPPRRMHLPTYPFAKDKYWIDPTVGLFAHIGPKPAMQRASALHPLLHENTSDLDQLRFSSVFPASSSAVTGDAVLSFPLLLEMARAALACARREATATTAVELGAMRFASPFVADGVQPLHIALFPSANGGIDFDIYSGDDCVHAQGSGELASAGVGQTLDPAALAARMSESAWPTDRGSDRRAPADWRLWCGAGEWLIAATDAHPVATPGLLLDAAFADRVFDALAPLLGLDRLAPRDLASLAVLSACASPMWIWARWRGDDTPALDMDWCDAHGTVALRWRGFVPAGATDAVAHPAAAMPSALVLDAPILGKPGAIALAEPATLPTVAGRHQPKPSASRLAALDATAVVQASPAPVTSSMPASPPLALHAPALATAVPAVAAANARVDVRGFLKRSLAQALYLDEANIDDDRPFVDLGLDSIVGVEWVKSINKGLGLEIGATRVYDYANLVALSAYVESQLPQATAPPGAANPPLPEPTPAAPVAAAATVPSVVLDLPAFDPPALNQPAPAAQIARHTVASLKPQLRSSLAQALYLDEAAIDDEKSFVDLGLDSIVGVEWVKTINKTYGLDISATRVYDYAHLHALAGFVHEELAKLPPDRIPQPVVASASAPVANVPVAMAAPMRAAAPLPTCTPAVPFAQNALHRRSRSLTAATGAASAPSSQASGRIAEKIAIVGMSGRYPGADNLEQFWRNLVEGRNSIREIPPSRWDVSAYYDPTPGKPGKVYCKWLGMLDGAEEFDPMFFQISPSEAEVMDPQHRLFMQESYRAFQDAGYASAALSNRKCGVYLGIMSSEYSLLLAKGNPLNVETTGNSFAIGAARIAYHLNLKGPAIPVDTACSSSLVAIHLACQALLNHEIDMGLAGGVSLYLIPESYLGMCRAGMLSRDGQCKTFDNRADGFVPGEGVGTVVLKRLSDAERDGDAIYGVIIGSGINQDGKTNGITAPSVNSQIDLLRDVYRRYDIDASTIDYVETHGTGTKLGDPIELEALSTVFKEHGGKRNACALGAVKTNLGHTSGAAGVAGVHKVLLSLRNGALAPNVNLQQENALFDFGASPFYVNRDARDWMPASGRKRRAAVSAFGFSGTNAHVVIEEYVPTLRQASSGPQACVVPLSARTAEQLRTMAQALLAFLERAGTDIDLRDLAYTLQIGRDPMRERAAWVSGAIADLQSQLRDFLAGRPGAQRGTVTRSQDTTIPTEEAAALLRREGAVQSAALAALWAEGAEIDWAVCHRDGQPRRLHRVPGYPFAKERYWPQSQPSVAAPAAMSAPVSASVVASAAAPADAGETRRATCYAPVWRAAALPAQRVAFGVDDVLLILDTDDRLFEQIRARLHTASPLKAIVLARLGEGDFVQEPPDRFALDASQPGQFESLLDALRGAGRTPSHVIHNIDAARLPADADATAAERALQVGVDALFGLCRALAAAGARQTPCALVSCFHADDGANLAACEALGAFYRSLALENSRYQGRVLALEHGADSDADHENRAIDTVTAIVEELQAPSRHEVEVRRRAGDGARAQRRVRALAEQALAAPSTGDAPLKHGGVYLITGGLGGLGLLFARHLAEHYRARLVLSGRSALDAASEQTLQQLHALGAEAIYLQADIADPDRARDLVAGAKARFGALNGVIHSAGVNDDALLIRKDRERFRRVLGPKVQGTLHLDRLTADEPLDLFVLFSSGAGSFGNVGQTDYAYANAFMDAFAEQRERARARRQRFGRSLSIGWPYWLAGGMQVSAADLQRTEERTGLSALPTDIGIGYWDTLLRSDLPRALALYGQPSKIAAYCNPSGSTAEATAAPTAASGAASPDRDALLAQARRYVCELVHAETRIPVDQIDIDERFEAFGFDSIMIGRLNATLEQDLGDLPKTLMYEYETVADLAAYLVDHATAAVTRRLAVAPDAPAARAPAVETATAPVAMAAPLPVAVAEAVPAQAEPIAIIGVHAQFPQADDLDTLWEHLRAGADLIQLVPENRWNHAEFYDPDPANAAHGKIYCKRGGFIEDFDKFDAGFFNIADAEAAIIDPQERRFLQSAWSAIEDAGYTRERLKQRYPKGKSADVGVFVGVTTNTYQLLAPEAWQRGRMVTPSAMPWSIANRVSYALDLQGPSMPVDTACSSSLVAVHLACESLRRRECQVALAGGVNLYLHPAKYQSFCHRRMLAVGDRHRSYGDGDDGFIPGEGVGTLVLKPLRLAERDGDRIYGVIRGSAYDHSGRSNGYATPNPNSQAQVIAQALAQANVPARSIGYIEGHGTGTRMGDSLEVAAITQAFAQQTTETGFCALASLKANIGHAESATSIAGIARILMQFRHRQIAPGIHADTVNPDIDFARAPCYLQTSLTPWESPAGVPRRALINAFGAGGVNACAVLEEYLPIDGRATATPADGSDALFVLSAMNAERLREYAWRHVDFLALNPDCDVAALCRTLQIGREAMPERLALVVGSAQQLRQTLQRWLDGDTALVAGRAPLWQGRADPRTGVGHSSREQRERMQALCASRDLAGLAAFWSEGGKVDWTRLDVAPAQPVVAAPVYPFARERHWVVDFATAELAPAAAAPARLHPLISHNASTLDGIRFAAALDGDRYYARDHRIQGQAVFPGAGFLEMACVAASIAGQHRVRRLRDIYWVQPLSLTDPQQDIPQQDMKIGLRSKSGGTVGGVEFAITTLDDDQETVLHCEGRALFEEARADHGSTSQATASPSLAEWRQRCGESHDAERYYRIFQKLGFDYGPTFRVIDSVAIGEGCALARLVLDPSLATDFEQYVLHPTLIDGALQAVVALLAADEGGVPHLPFAIDEIEILGSLTPHCHALVERVGDAHGGAAGILQFNIHILSESGEPLVKITHFHVRALVPPAPSRSDAAGDRARSSLAVNP